MPAIPLKSDYAIIEKSPREGNESRFSTGKGKESIICKEIWDRRLTRQVEPYSKVFNDETTVVLHTYNELAKELQSDDAITWKNYKYSVQSIRPICTGIGYFYEIELKGGNGYNL